MPSSDSEHVCTTLTTCYYSNATMIKRLDLETASRIRAGTVVASPESVVRGLVLNALDAGARRVDVKLHLGTLSLSVEDDGEGMSDLKKAGLPSFTSKVEEGACGETLSALATSCSKLVIVTKRKEDAVWSRKSFNDETELEIQTLERFFEPQFGAYGTTVMASRLFGSTPVRWEIAMQSQGAMMDAIRVALFEVLADAKDVNLRLLVNEGEDGFRKIIDTGCCKSITEAYATFFGKRPLHRLLTKQEGVTFTTFVSQEPILSSRYQFIFLNNKPIRLTGSERKSIAEHIVKMNYSFKGYFGRSTKGHPSYIILLKTQENCDWSSKAILNFILRNLPQANDTEESHPETPRRKAKSMQQYGQNSPFSLLTATPESTPDSPGLSQVNQELLLEDFKVISQVASRFILLKSRDAFYIVDQHACDERIQYEHLLRDFLEDLHDPFIDMRVKCDKSIYIEVNVTESEIFKNQKHHLLAYGVDFHEEHGKIGITHLPAILIPESKNTSSLKSFLLGWVTALNLRTIEYTPSQDWFMAIQQIPSAIRDLLITKACKLAIKFGKVLTHEEMDHLMSELGKCRLFTQCAHGRPTIVPLETMDDLESLEPFREDFIV